jgi:hypothetical protein
MSAQIYFLPGALEARQAARRRKGRGRTQRAPEPQAFARATPLDILNRIAVDLGLPALGEDGQTIPWPPGR